MAPEPYRASPFTAGMLGPWCVVVTAARHLLLPAHAAFMASSTRDALLAVAQGLEEGSPPAAHGPASDETPACRYASMALAQVAAELTEAAGALSAALARASCERPDDAARACLRRHVGELERLMQEWRFKTFGSVLAHVTTIARRVEALSDPKGHVHAALATSSRRLRAALQAPASTPQSLAQAFDDWLARLEEASVHAAARRAVSTSLDGRTVGGGSVLELVETVFLARSNARTRASSPAPS